VASQPEKSMRKYNLAHRYREFAEVSLSASMSERPLSVGMTYLYADDSYSRSELGMTESNEDRFTVDFSWAVSETASMYLTAGSESIDAVQLGSTAFSEPVWEASHDDDFTHYGGGFRVTGASDKFDLTFDYTHSDGETEILFAGQGVAAAPLPNLVSMPMSVSATSVLKQPIGHLTVLRPIQFRPFLRWAPMPMTMMSG